MYVFVPSNSGMIPNVYKVFGLHELIPSINTNPLVFHEDESPANLIIGLT